MRQFIILFFSIIIMISCEKNKDINNETGHNMYVEIPDSNFEKALIEKGYDTILDGKVPTESIDTITVLIVPAERIYSIKGIEYFINLEYLNCEHNRLSDSLDLSKNVNLKELYLRANLLSSIDVSKNTKLKVLDVSVNRILSSLDISNNVAMEVLKCSDNQLTNLDVTENKALTYLSCVFNEISELNISENELLKYLYCYYNELRHLNVSYNSNLEVLSCSSNELVGLEVTNNPNLTTLGCDHNNLFYLKVKNIDTNNFVHFSAEGYDLLCIEVDYPEWATASWTNIDEHTFFSTSCDN